ncbi:MAG: DUF1385 domain-containing protein, partial [Clostridia bacterium]|nr:DUF1385 domain-containing protein [Clostridia bacterium]
MKKSKCAEQPKKRTSIGGQALIEGIMMMGPDRIATAVKKLDGSHVVREEEYVPLSKRLWLARVPFLRGIFAFGSSLANGTRQLMWSADQV